MRISERLEYREGEHCQGQIPAEGDSAPPTLGPESNFRTSGWLAPGALTFGDPLH